jgi:ferredoxin
MSALVDVDLLSDMKKFGTVDVSACFSCGNCTAICPLADNDGTFPRRIIRLAQVGLKDELLSSKELWTCYHCGLCSDSCPTEADPGEFMATARRYAIASYDRTHLARTMYTRPVVGTAIAVGVAAFFAAFMYSTRGPRSTETLALFEFIPEPVIHWTGIVVMTLMVLAGVVGVLTMVARIGRHEGVTPRALLVGGPALGRSWKAAWSAVGIESIGQRRYREDCKDDMPVEPWYRRRWFIHAMTIWGFLGLFAATMLDYGLSIIGVKETGTPIPIWYPSRLIGTVAGVMLIYGVTMFMINRATRYNRAATKSQASDWLLLVLLLITGITGFLIEVALYTPSAPAWGYWVFLFHVAVAMELMLLLPFTKFAHAIYRPVALFFYALAGESRRQTQDA